MTNLLKRDKGFTLIEIVLVLAIAGLILLMVFLAVAGAQRSRRDTQREQDLSRMAAQMEAWASNNNGTYPNSQNAINGATGTTFVSNYLKPNTNWQDPKSGAYYGNNITYAQYTATSNLLGPGIIDMYTSVKCGPNGTMVAGNANDYAISMGLEQGVACRSNDQ